MMEFIQNITADQVVSYISVLLAILSGIRSFLMARKADKDIGEAIILTVNTLKDEAKMLDGKFSDGTIVKLDQVSEALTIGVDAKKKVEEVIASGTEVKDFRIASINGKRIYLSDITKATTIATVARDVWKRLKGI